MREDTLMKIKMLADSTVERQLKEIKAEIERIGIRHKEEISKVYAELETLRTRCKHSKMTHNAGSQYWDRDPYSECQVCGKIFTYSPPPTYSPN